MRYKIEYLESSGSYSHEGTDFVTGKNKKDAIKNWLFSHFNDIVDKDSAYTSISKDEEWLGQDFSLTITPAKIIKNRSKKHK